MNLLKTIKSNNFALWVAILSVIVQSFHSYTAFYNSSSLAGTGWGIAQGILFSIVIDMAILFYTVRNRKDIALGAAFVMVVINAYYYYQHLGLTFEFGFGVFLSLIIPCSVYFYSEEIKPDVITLDHRDNRIRELESIIRNGKAENKRQAEEIDKLNKERLRLFTAEEVNEYRERIEELKIELSNAKEDNYSGRLILSVPEQKEIDKAIEEIRKSHTDDQFADLDVMAPDDDKPEDKSLVGIQSDKAYNPTRTDGQKPDPDELF